MEGEGGGKEEGGGEGERREGEWAWGSALIGVEGGDLRFGRLTPYW